MLNKLIAFTLWGNSNIYWYGAQKNIELATKYYPDWTLRFYIDSKSNNDLIKSITGENVEVILMESDNNYVFSNHNERFNHSGLFWRFLALKDPNVDIVLSRDCDSRFSQREVDAVNEWLDSDKDFHIMRDHPHHQVPILTGMWGARNKILNNIDEHLSYWTQWQNKGRYQAEDQDFLGQIIYPLIKDRALEHSEFGINYGGEIKLFPSVRNNYEFIGDVFDENEQRHPEYWQYIKNRS